MQYRQYVETHYSACEDRREGGGSGNSLQVPRNSLNSKKGSGRNKEKASLARLSWFASAAVGRRVFWSAVAIRSYIRFRAVCFKEFLDDPSRSPGHRLRLKRQFVRKSHCTVCPVLSSSLPLPAYTSGGTASLKFQPSKPSEMLNVTGCRLTFKG